MGDRDFFYFFFMTVLKFRGFYLVGLSCILFSICYKEPKIYSVDLAGGYGQLCCCLLTPVISSGNLICYRNSSNWQHANFHHANAAVPFHLVSILDSLTFLWRSLIDSTSEFSFPHAY